MRSDTKIVIKRIIILLKHAANNLLHIDPLKKITEIIKIYKTYTKPKIPSKELNEFITVTKAAYPIEQAE